MRENCQNIFVTIKATNENMTKEVNVWTSRKNKFYSTGMIMREIKSLPLKLYFAIKMPLNFLT